MYKGQLKKDNKGFTIIEVMIVLVIAAVIILIVFLAVPALQRNSRNNQRKNSAARVVTAAKEWRTTHNNAMPATADIGDLESLTGTLAHYDGINSVGAYNGFIANLATPALVSQLGDTVNIITNARCATATTMAASNGVVAVYSVETGNGITLACAG